MHLGKDFTHFAIPVAHDVTIRGWQKGSGPPLLLLHGFPQTHLIWHKVAERLSATYTVVAPDLRGYGASSKPAGDASHKAYAKSTMAHDLATVMERLHHDAGTYFVCGHDRGGRVAHQLCVLYPKRVRRVMVLDICPTLAMYEATDQLFATAYWHWFFLIQPAPFPEDVILANPRAMIQKMIRGAKSGSDVFHPHALEAYGDQFKDRHGVHAMCEDYRAAASVDLEEQRDDIKHGRKIQCPLRVYWGKYGLIEQKFSAIEEWKKVSSGEVDGGPLDCGHYIPEEAPDALMQHILEFFR